MENLPLEDTTNRIAQSYCPLGQISKVCMCHYCEMFILHFIYKLFIRYINKPDSTKIYFNVYPSSSWTTIFPLGQYIDFTVAVLPTVSNITDIADSSLISRPIAPPTLSSCTSVIAVIAGGSDVEGLTKNIYRWCIFDTWALSSGCLQISCCLQLAPLKTIWTRLSEINDKISIRKRVLFVWDMSLRLGL